MIINQRVVKTVDQRWYGFVMPTVDPMGNHAERIHFMSGM